MISIKVSSKALKISKQRLVENANRRYRRIVYDAFEAMLGVSYQYSGNFTMNWHILTQRSGGIPAYVEYGVKGSVDYQQPEHAGSAAAIEFARQKVVRAPFNYNDKVYFVNSSPLEFTATTVRGPDGKTMNLRPENIIPGATSIKSYVDAYLQRKYTKGKK